MFPMMSNKHIQLQPQLMPLLLRGLDLPDSNMRIDVIETLQSAAQDMATFGETVQASVSEHAPSLVTAMLKNSRAQEQSSSVGSQ